MANHAHAHDDHRPDVAKYMKVFGALMVLTVVTVAISKLQFSRPVAIGLGLAVACVKASLVCAVFMHLWGEKRLIHHFLWITVGCALILLIPMIDCGIIIKQLTQRMPVAGQGPAGGHAGGETDASGEHTETHTMPKGGH